MEHPCTLRRLFLQSLGLRSVLQWTSGLCLASGLWASLVSFCPPWPTHKPVWMTTCGASAIVFSSSLYSSHRLHGFLSSNRSHSNIWWLRQKRKVGQIHRLLKRCSRSSETNTRSMMFQNKKSCMQSFKGHCKAQAQAKRLQLGILMPWLHPNTEWRLLSVSSWLCVLSFQASMHSKSTQHRSIQIFKPSQGRVEFHQRLEL